jgi:hypothetical protein
MLLKNKLKLLLFFTVAVLYSLQIKGQQLNPKYKVGVSALLFSDYGYPKPGFAMEASISRLIYKKIYARLWIHKSNSNYYPIPKNKWEGFVNYGNEDVYASYFVGKPVDGFFKNKYDTYNKNAYLFNLAINRAFGKKRLKFIPEIGLSYGRAKEFNFNLKEITYTNGIITSAKSQAYFAKNQVFGKNLSLTIDYKLKNNYNIQFNYKLYLTNPKEVDIPNLGVQSQGNPYEGAAIGFTLTKSFDYFKKKSNR